MSSETQGRVGADVVTIKVTEKNLSLKREDTESLIPFENIIAIIQGPSRSEDEHLILYVHDDVTGPEDAKFLWSFRNLVVANLPEQVVERFKAAEGNRWLSRYSNGAEEASLHVILSTGSGTGLASTAWEQLVRPLLTYIGVFEGSEFRLHRTTSESSVTDLTKSTLLSNANRGIDQSILLLSGDGGIVDIVNALLSGERGESYRKPTISLLPLGTGNAMANSSGVSDDSTFGLSTMLRGSPKEIPLFRATFSPGARLLSNQGQDEQSLHGNFDGMPAAYGAVVCSWGLHATLVADSDTVEYRKFGAERFKMAGKEALYPSDGSLPHAYKGQVSIRRPGSSDWEIVPRHEHGYILATLVSQLEAGFTISPSSKPLDGKLRLLHFAQLSGQDAMEIMGKAYKGGSHTEDERVGYEEIEGLRIAFDEEDANWRRICLDGKIIRVEKRGWVEVRGGIEGVVDLVAKE